MHYQVMRLLDAPEVEWFISGIGQRVFEDGKRTAHGRAREVKNNLQAQTAGQAFDEIDRRVLDSFQRSREFQNFVLPKRAARPLYSRYDPGMTYGPHVDNALIKGIRTDFAVTLFLSPPHTYDGGELVIDLPHGSEQIKLDAGEAIVYSADTVHHVAPVARGVRLAAVTWVQSVVSDDRLRGTLFDLSICMNHASTLGNNELLLRLSKTYHNLLRYAAEP